MPYSEESDLPSTLDNSTIYAITDSGETEIEKLIIRGMEFAGGGVPDTGEPMISSPSNGSTINLGDNTSGQGVSKIITIKGKNLTGDLTVAVGTGLTVSYGQSTGQSSVTIPMAQALLGAQVTIAYSGSGALDDGSLVISHGGSVLSSVVVVVVAPVALAAVKFTRQQKVITDIYPGPNTRIEIDMKFDGEYLDCSSDTGRSYSLFGSTDDESYNPKKVFRGNTGQLSQMQDTATTFSLFIWTETGYVSTTYEIKVAKTDWKNRGTLILDMINHQASFNGASVAVPTKTTTMQTPMMFGGNPASANPFGFNEVILYSIKHYENNVLTHEYLPKTLAGIAGLYDTKTNTFITSETNVELEAING